jgi:DNA-3-methyladenine glycosylase II
MTEYFPISEEAISCLKKKDKKLSTAIDSIGIIKRPVNTDFFSALIRSFLEQQISMKAAETIWNRIMLLTCNQMSPTLILTCSEEDLRAQGISSKKILYMKEAAEKILSGELDIEALTAMSDSEICKELVSLKGVGLWTAQMMMIFSLKRQDVISFDDLGIRRGICRLYHHKTLTKIQFERYKKRYSPYGSVAGFYIWEISKS